MASFLGDIAMTKPARRAARGPSSLLEARTWAALRLTEASAVCVSFSAEPPGAEGVRQERSTTQRKVRSGSTHRERALAHARCQARAPTDGLLRCSGRPCSPLP